MKVSMGGYSLYCIAARLNLIPVSHGLSRLSRHLVKSVDGAIGWQRVIGGVEKCIPILKFSPASRFGASAVASVSPPSRQTRDWHDQLTQRLVSSIVANHELHLPRSVNE